MRPILFLALLSAALPVFALDASDKICPGTESERSKCLANAQESATFDLNAVLSLLDKKAQQHAQKVQMPDDVLAKWGSTNNEATRHFYNYIIKQCQTLAYFPDHTIAGDQLGNAITACKVKRLREYQSFLTDFYAPILD